MTESHAIMGTLASFGSLSRPAAAIARGHISIFYPALIILDIYVSAWALLVALGHEGTPIIKVMAIVVFAVVPLLLIYAFLRFMTVSVMVTRHKILIRRGWPFSRVRSIARKDIKHAHADFSCFGKLTGAGALTIITHDGTRHRVKDISSPDKLADRLNGAPALASACATGIDAGFAGKA